MDPSPTNSAIPFNVLPIPSFTAVTIVSAGIPAIKPIEIAPIKIEIIAWILNLIINTYKIIRPITAAITSLVGFKASVSVAFKSTSLSHFFSSFSFTSDVLCIFNQTIHFLHLIVNTSDVFSFSSPLCTKKKRFHFQNPFFFVYFYLFFCSFFYMLFPDLH